jgi:hypothetical protein
MRIPFLVLPALLLAGVAAAQSASRTDPADSQVNVPRVEYRSAFEGYRPFAEGDLRDWRKSNDDVGAASGHAGHRPSQGPRQQISKPRPGKPESSGGPAEKPRDAPPHQGHGEHK